MLPARETQARTAASDLGAGPAGTRQKAQDTCAGLRSKDVNPSCVEKFSGEINYVLQRESMIFLLKKALKVLY